MPKIKTAGYKRFWELKQLAGRNADGSKRAVEGYRDMLTGKFHAPENGWNGQPLPLPPGERPVEINNNYAKNYEATFGHR